MTLPVDIRSAAADDLSFIMSSWLNSYRDASEFGRALRKSVYFAHYRPVVEAILSRSHVAVVCPKDDPTTICGWICYEYPDRNVVHYTYVKQPFRNMGLLRYMLTEIGLDDWVFRYSHETRSAVEIGRKKTTILHDPGAMAA